MEYDELEYHRNEVVRKLTSFSDAVTMSPGSMDAPSDYDSFLVKSAFENGCQYLQALDALLLSEQCEPEEGL